MAAEALLLSAHPRRLAMATRCVTSNEQEDLKSSQADPAYGQGIDADLGFKAGSSFPLFEVYHLMD